MVTPNKNQQNKAAELKVSLTVHKIHAQSERKSKHQNLEWISPQTNRVIKTPLLSLLAGPSTSHTPPQCLHRRLLARIGPSGWFHQKKMFWSAESHLTNKSCGHFFWVKPSMDFLKIIERSTFSNIMYPRCFYNMYPRCLFLTLRCPNKLPSKRRLWERSLNMNKSFVISRAISFKEATNVFILMSTDLEQVIAGVEKTYLQNKKVKN